MGMYIERLLRNQIEKRWDDDRILLITGPRQVGKTTLLHKICNEKGDYLFLNGDDAATRESLTNISKKKWENIIGRHKTVFIDEAHRIDSIELGVKIIYDQIKGVKVLLSGSSAIDLNSRMKEPLTGRKWEFSLFPISWKEYMDHSNFIEARGDLENRLIFGMYPEVMTNAHDQEDLLYELANSYLFKDLYEYQGIRNPEMLTKLLVALALQMGNEVSYNELAQLLQIDRATVEKYISLLEKTFVIFRLPALNTNKRNELKNTRKIFFYDNGIRNAVLKNFNPLSLRNDVGALWENFLIAERMKYNYYSRIRHNAFFWRNYHQQEVDYVEEIKGQFYPFEFKWNPKKKAKLPSSFSKHYGDSHFDVIHRDNFEEFVV